MKSYYLNCFFIFFARFVYSWQGCRITKEKLKSFVVVTPTTQTQTTNRNHLLQNMQVTSITHKTMLKH